jgi:hypothetical protein
MRWSVKDGQRYRDMKKAAGNDPGVRFDDKKQQVETVYTYQQIHEQYGNTPFRQHFDHSLHEANGRVSGQPDHDSLKYFGVDGYTKQERRDRAAITKISEQRLRKFSYDDHDAMFGAARRNRLDQGLANAGRDKGAHYLLVDQRYHGFSIGEGQSEAHSRRYLTDNMGKLKGSGVNTLYVEHARHREYQGMINHWMQSPEPRLNGPLANYVDGADKKSGLTGKDSLRSVFETAKANKVRVVGIDDAAASGRSTGKFIPEERAAMMNPYAEHVVRSDEARQDGKYVVLVREAHNNTHPGRRGGVPGVSQLLEIPAVMVGPDGKLVRQPEDPATRVARTT